MNQYTHHYALVTSFDKGVNISEQQARKVAGDFNIDDAHRANIHQLRTSVKRKAVTGRRMWNLPLDSGYVQVTTRLV